MGAGVFGVACVLRLTWSLFYTEHGAMMPPVELQLGKQDRQPTGHTSGHVTDTS